MNNLFLQVDKEVNLLQGITFAEGISLEKVGIEISGQRVDIQDPTHYTPELPGIISLVLTLTKPDGSIIEVKVEDLAVNALDFTSPALETADVVNNNYPWFNNMTQWYKEH